MSFLDSLEPARKPRRKRKADAMDDNIITLPEDPVDDDDGAIRIDPDTGTVEITHDDGSITIDPTGESLEAPIDTSTTEFDDNLADKVDALQRANISEELLTAIEAHKQDRGQWEAMRAKTLELLGMKLDEPKSDVSTSSLGMSTSVVRDPVLLYSVEKFRANAYSELCPAGGPVKTANYADETQTSDEDADALTKDLNFFFTQTATEYYPDTRYMLWWTGLASGTFKKVYFCPRRRRPVSEFVDGGHLICPTNATDLKNAGLVAHQSSMRKALLKRMQYLGVYRDIDLSDPMQANLNAVDLKKASIEGVQPLPQRIEDQDYTIYECYCELNLKGFEHKDKETGEETGLMLPYKVTIEETSREILEIRRNWDEDDEDQIAKIPFVLFPYSTGMSRIYGSGLGQMLGNLAMALTALMRISIDGGMAANYPGLLRAKGTGRQLSNEIRVPPGGCAEIDTGGLPIQQAVMGMPYKDVSGMVVSLMEQLRNLATQLGGSAELPVGEGTADIPVGTILAQIEQATKVEGAVHKALHDAQKEEFQLFIDLFQKDPESLWRGNRRPALGLDKETRLAKFKKALDNWRIVPVSDPNVPSETHRLMKAYAMLQLGQGDPTINQTDLKKKVAKALKIDDWESLIVPVNPNQPMNPLLMADLAIKKQLADTAAAKAQSQHELGSRKIESTETIEAMKLAYGHVNSAEPVGADPTKAASLELQHQKLQQSAAQMLIDAKNAHEDRQSAETTKALDIAARIATHPGSQTAVNEQLIGLSPLLKPAPEDHEMAEGGVVTNRTMRLDDVLDEIDAFVRQRNERPRLQ